ncbi:maternal embryonic leucine zipper kinase-like [Cylas formicarius]|uniref:maternal embryonic leucine zipper kinase-like n=1 Tax=Cylas formicarius TaxID=197179 RepID=UPI002958AA2D|nr:maternal embryonic leucine zipper kinase-like [Cylas formicarius]
MVRYRALRGFYETERTIGCGGFAKVKLATHLATGEKVAIKIMDKTTLGEDLHRVKLELEALKSFSHEHICQLYQVIETDSHYFIVMEYCSGGELFDHIVEKNRLTESESRMFFRQITSAVAYLHSLGYAHRDLKPENVLLDKNQNLKLIDFGLCAKPQGGMDNPLFTSCGSPTYAAPELVMGRQYLGQEVDVWAMGVLLYALLTGSLPFDDVNVDNLYKKILCGKYCDPPYISRQSSELIRSMLQVDPEKRITVAQLLSHPWLTLGVLDPVDFQPKHYKTYDSACLNAMARHLDTDVQSLWGEVSKWKYDYGTATYFLLMCRRKRGESLKLNPLFRPEAMGCNFEGEKVRGVLTPSTSNGRNCLSPYLPKTPSSAVPMRRSRFNGRIEDDDKRIAGRFPDPKKPTCVPQRSLKRPRSPFLEDASPVPFKKAATPGKLTPKTPERKRRASNSDTPGSTKKVLDSIEKSLNRVRYAFTPKRNCENAPRQPVLLNNNELFSVSTTQCKDPELIINELSKGFKQRGIECKRKGFTLKGNLEPNQIGRFGGCSFELEICYLPILGLPHTSNNRSGAATKAILKKPHESRDHQAVTGSHLVGIRRKRLKGDSWCYKKVCEQILALASPAGSSGDSAVSESAV